MIDFVREFLFKDSKVYVTPEQRSAEYIRYCVGRCDSVRSRVVAQNVAGLPALVADLEDCVLAGADHSLSFAQLRALSPDTEAVDDLLAALREERRARSVG